MAKQKQQKVDPNFSLKKIIPKTQNQKFAFDSYYSGQNICLHGTAGTGKTFIALYLAFNDILTNASNKYEINIIRSAVPTRNIGFLPGNSNEKMKDYEDNYIAICSELFGRDDAYEIMKHRGTIKFTSTSFLRGCTFRNSIIIIDEFANLSFQEFNTLMTRIGPNCTVILSGDINQTDLRKDDTGHLYGILSILQEMKEFDLIEFNINDIVRSGFVKSYLIAKEKIMGDL